MTWVWPIAATVAIVGLLYWLLIATEGTYLGSRIVVLLYDWTAARYDKGKGLHIVEEAIHFGMPFAEALSACSDPAPRVLDVATGTGRVPLALLRQREHGLLVVATDRSRRMLDEAARSLATSELEAQLMCQDAAHLSFADAVFDGVSCLEALEFMWDADAVLEEMVRVLKPGGVLLISNRVGTDAVFFPGRMCGRGRLERRLRESGLEALRTRRWQVHYDLLWARKPSQGGSRTCIGPADA